MALIDLELPADSHPETRIYWAGEAFADLAEGKIDNELGWFIWGMIVGWTDGPCTKGDREAYLRLAHNFETFLRRD